MRMFPVDHMEGQRHGNELVADFADPGSIQTHFLAKQPGPQMRLASDGIERQWEIAAPVLAHPPEVELYEPGSWGPVSIDRIVAPDRWALPR